MKNLLLPFFALLLLMGCEKESTLDVLPVQEISESVSVDTRGSNKINICHKGHIINVNSNALNAHLKHGDEVEFGQLGNYNLTYRINGSEYNHEMEITQSDNGSFSGLGRSITTGQEWTVDGTIDSDGNYSFTLDYTNSSYFATATGTFECDGSGYYGDWGNNSQSGTWTGTYQSH